LNCCNEKEWHPKSDLIQATDKTELLRIYYTGDEPSGIVSIDSAGDMTFEHGVAGAEVVDADAKLASGVLDMSADVGDFHSLEAFISSLDNWKCKLKAALPDDEPHVTTTGHFLEVTGAAGGTGDCKPAAGYGFFADGGDCKYASVALTNNQGTNVIHNADTGVEIRVRRVGALLTYASGVTTLGLYACNDVTGVSTLVRSFTPGATTVGVYYPATTVNATEVHWQTYGQRMVFKAVSDAVEFTGSGAAAYDLRIDGDIRVVNPMARKDLMASNMGG